MANGDALTPAKTIMASVGVSIGIITVGLTLISSRVDEHGDEIGGIRNDMGVLRQEIEARTDQRYRASDAARDFNLVNFRFERNEQNINKCLQHIENHKGIGETYVNDFLFWGDTSHDADPPKR